MNAQTTEADVRFIPLPAEANIQQMRDDVKAELSAKSEAGWYMAEKVQGGWYIEERRSKSGDTSGTEVGSDLQG